MVSKIIKVVAAIIKKDNNIFATQRGYGNYKDWWEFPGGKIESGESPETALVREIKEELDTEIQVDEYFMTVEYDYPEFHLSMDCFWCSILCGKLTLLEHEAAKWLPVDDLRQVKWLPADLEIIEKIESISEKEKDPCQQTLEYYAEHAEDFVIDTYNIGFNDVQDKFMSLLPKGGAILDFGCGSGRDSLFFIKKGFKVEAVDGSLALCKIASETTGLDVKNMLFSDLDETEKYDGIWACASILHLPKEELVNIIPKMLRAIKKDGYIYTSFKYGTFEGVRNNRFYTDFTEESFRLFMMAIPSLEIDECWISNDVRHDRGDEKWLNLILKNKDAV